MRGRVFQCPNGYASGGSYCYRETSHRDLHKNLGPQCPQCGNPISLGIGGKHQEERDYVGAGRLPLEFSRHYNNLLTSSAWYSVTDYPGSVADRVLMASDPDEPEKQIIGMDRMGVMWRHSYQRGIVLRTTDAIQTAAAYRPDGKVYAFNNYNGTFVGDTDVIDSLVRLGDGTWRYTTAQGEQTEEYDANGRLTRINDRGGEFQVLAYDACNLLRTVTDNFGRTLTLDYTEACSAGTTTAYRVSSVTDPSGNMTGFVYDSNGRLSQVNYPDTTTRTYHYDGAVSTELTGISDEANTRYISWTYDANRRANLSEGPAAAGKVSIVYSPADPCTGCTVGTVTSAIATDANNNATTYTFSIIQGVNRVAGITRPAGSGTGTATETYGYDVNGNVINKKDFNGNRTCSAFDLARNLETVRVEGFASGASCPANVSAYTPAAGTRQRKISTQWHATFRKPTQIDEAGKRSTFTYDVSGNVLTKTELDTTTSESRTWTYTYNPFGKVLTEDGPRTDATDVTTYTYYSCATGYHCGQINTVENAAGHITTYNTYNAHGQPLTVTDANGVVTTLTYDLRRRLTSRTVGSETTTFDYWPTGLQKKVTLPDSSYLQYTYDTARRLTDITDADGNRTHYTLDLMGNRTGEHVYDPTNSLTRTRSRVFDALNRVKNEIGAAGTANVTTTHGYDNSGNQTSIAAPLGRNTAQAYDELNRLKQVTDPLTGATQYGYNALDQLISVTDPRSKVTSYSYNALGDLKQLVSPDTGTTTNAYDSSGNLTSSTDARNKTATYAYDALNRITGVTYADQVIGYTYDTGTNHKGRLTLLTDNSGSTSWGYDAQGRVVSRQQTMGAISKSVGYAYDTSGRLQTVTLPSGNAITYGYANGKVVSLTLNGSTTVLSNASYHPFGPSTGWTWGNATLAVRDYDQDGNIILADSAGLRTYSYDDAFRITGITDASDANLSQGYGYDLLDRLTSASGTGLNQSWTYDANGNRLTEGGSQASTYTVSTTNNRLASVTGTLARTYAYDAAGNTTGDGSTTYAYNDAGRMVSATRAGVTSTYSLNGLGQRVRKIAGAVSTYFAYDEAGHLIGEYDNSGALISETIWFGDLPTAVIKPNGSGGVNVFYVHTDHLNTPRKVTRPSDNAIVWRWDSDPFGTTLADENPAGLGMFRFSLRFPGQYYDGETGLHYNYFRDYDPATGRYVQSDPIGLDGGTNTFAYVGSNPLQYADPLGWHKGDKWYGFTNRDFQRWFHRCWKQPGDPDADKQQIAEAYAEWLTRGSPTGDKCDNRPPPPPPAPAAGVCGESCKEEVVTVVTTAGTAYVIYRCARMIPSLFPPLWPTIPANVVVP